MIDHGLNVINWAQFFPSEDGTLGEYLVRSGRPINCRLDFRLTRLEELKKAAVVLCDLNAAIQKLAYETEGEPVLRVMLARSLFTQAQFDLKYAFAEAVIKKANDKLAAEKLARKPVRTKKIKAVIDLGDVFLEVPKVLPVLPLSIFK